MSASSNDRFDVVIAGAGVAGLSAAVLLARAGLRVACIDPEGFPRTRVGESLDWSAPQLLSDLGLPRDELVAAGIGTYKREIRARTVDGDLLIGRPPEWVRRRPLRFEYQTAHLDRLQFDEQLFEVARGAGVEFEWDHVRRVDFHGESIVGFQTRSGRRLSGDWFVDASGRRRLIARSAGIESRRWGVPRISLWSQCTCPMAFEGTMLYLDGSADELTWAWEIPLAACRTSVGVVMPQTAFRHLRAVGDLPAQILVDELARLRRRRGNGVAGLETVGVRSYRPDVVSLVARANWMMAGEAAALVDPLTSIGVTLAMRHASEAARLIIAHVRSPHPAGPALAEYDRRVRLFAGLSNSGIDELMYRPRLRRAVGIRWASRAYVTLGYGTSSLYTRLAPITPMRAAAVNALFRAGSGWVRAWRVVGRVAAPTAERGTS